MEKTEEGTTCIEFDEILGEIFSWTSQEKVLFSFSGRDCLLESFGVAALQARQLSQFCCPKKGNVYFCLLFISIPSMMC